MPKKPWYQQRFADPAFSLGLVLLAASYSQHALADGMGMTVMEPVAIAVIVLGALIPIGVCIFLLKFFGLGTLKSVLIGLGLGLLLDAAIVYLIYKISDDAKAETQPPQAASLARAFGESGHGGDRGRQDDRWFVNRVILESTVPASRENQSGHLELGPRYSVF